MNARRIAGARKSAVRKQAPRSAARVGPSASERKRAYCVLVVDSDDARRGLLADFLKRDGFVVTALADGHDAVKLIATGCVDLVISGVVTKTMHSLELLQVIRAINLSVPVLIMSDGNTRVHAVYLECAQMLGASKTFGYPTRYRAIRDYVRQLFRQSQSARRP